MRLHRAGGFCLSQSGRARQVLLFAHGSWSGPIWGRTLELGPISLGRKKLHHPGDGYIDVPAGLVVFFYTTHGEYGKRAAAHSVLANPPAAYQGLVDEAAGIHAKGVFNVDPTNPQRIHDYAIAFLEGEDTVWNDHQTGRKDADVDLLVLENGREAHLSDAFALIRSAPDGNNYRVFHCCHCRYTEPD